MTRVARRTGRAALAAAAALVAAGALLAAYELAVTPLVHERQHERLVTDWRDAKPRTAPGDALAVLQIPSIDVNGIVVEGDSDEALRAGPGHRVGTPVPGHAGNAVILGHRERYGAPFERLDDLEPGASVFVRVRNEPVRRFTVSTVRRIGGDDEAALSVRSTRTDGAQLTLVTSDARWSRDRIVVQADAPGSASSTAAEPRTFEEATHKGLDPQRGSLLFTGEMAFAYVLTAGAGLAFAELRRHHRRMVLAAVTTPVVLVVALLAIQSLERLLPATL